MNAVPILLVREGPTLTVLLGVDEAECRRAAGILARWWGAPAGTSQAPGGQRFEVRSAEGLTAPYDVALVALDISARVLSIRLTSDRESAVLLARDRGADVAEVRILPTDTLGLALTKAWAPRDPRILSTTFCPRCGDHPLHVQAVFDDRSRRDGTRICNACGMLEALKLERS